ncbi:hypothetical protein Tco_1333469 [Tanacetum coccineum]
MRISRSLTIEGFVSAAVLENALHMSGGGQVLVTTHSIHSTHHEDDGESTAEHQFVSGGGFVITSISVLSGLSLGRCVLSQSELLKRHEQLNSEHVDLCNCSDIQLEELNHLRTDLQRQMQANDGLSK